MKGTTLLSVLGATGGVCVHDWPDGAWMPGEVQGSLPQRSWCALPGIDQTRGEKCHCVPSLGTRVLHGDCWRDFRSMRGGVGTVAPGRIVPVVFWPQQTHVIGRGTGLHRAHAVRAMFINAAGTFLSSDRPSCHHGDGNATPVSFFDGELASRAFPRLGPFHEVAPNHPRITTALTLVAGPTMPSRLSRPGR